MAETPDRPRRPGGPPKSSRPGSARPAKGAPSGGRPQREGDKPAWKKRDDDSSRTPRTPRADGDTPQWKKREGDRPAGPRRDGEKPAWQKRDGAGAGGPRRDGDKPAWKKREDAGSGAPRRDGEKPAWQKRDGAGAGGPRRDGDKLAWQKRDGDRPARPPREGDRASTPRRDGDVPAWKKRSEAGSSAPRRDGDKPAWQKRDGDRASSPRRDGDKPAWQKREGGRPARDGGERRLWTRDGAPARGDRSAQERELPEDKDPYGTKSVRAHHDAPPIPEDVVPNQLDRVARAQLKTLSKENADEVARHLVMAARLIDDDPETAHRHAISAARRAGRIAVVRETLAITAYATEDYALTLRELRTYRRISGRDDQLPMMVDSERGLGRPEKALELGRSVPRTSLPVEVQVELAIAMSGARLDLGQTEAALTELQIPQLDPDTAFSWSPALFDAYGTVLEDLGRTDEAATWYERSDRATAALAATEASDDEDELEIEVVEEFDGEESDGEAFGDDEFEVDESGVDESEDLEAPVATDETELDD